MLPKLSSQWHSFSNDSFNKNHNNNSNNNGGNQQQCRQRPSASFATSSCRRTWREVLAGILNSVGFLRNFCPSFRLGSAQLGCCICWERGGGRGRRSLSQEFVFKIWRTRPFGRQKAAATICKLRMNKTWSGEQDTLALMKRAASEDMCPRVSRSLCVCVHACVCVWVCPLTTARLHKQDNKALNMHSSPSPAWSRSRSRSQLSNTIAWQGRRTNGERQMASV